MAGSVCTPEMTAQLLKAGADIVRVGIGSGSVCTTRKVKGVGYPQLSAVLECAEAAHKEGGFICSDGGCVVPGDICKAFGAGADFVMLGGMLAGHAECEGTIKYGKKGGKRVPLSMQFYGMTLPQLRFLTKNEGKFRELSELIDSSKYLLVQDKTEISELQSEDMQMLIRDKVLKAFERIRRPLIVDHTALQFDLLNGFPSGLTSIFYDKLLPEGIAKLIGRSDNPGVTAVTYIGYCDGKKGLSL